MSTELVIGLIVFVLIIFWIVSIYNKLVSYKNQYENGFSQIDIQLKRRLDLIPNLVSIAKEYMKHESETLIKVTEARNNMLAASDAANDNPGGKEVMANLVASESALQSAMTGFNLSMEAYPDLKANQNMMQLSEEMTSTENRIGYARQGYNDLVMKFNEYRQSFPAIMFSGIFGFGSDAELLTFEESKEKLNEALKISF